MSKYFNYFPKTFYKLNENSNDVDTVTNITSRFGFEQTFKNNSAVYYEYDVQDSDTPEIIASKIYKDPEKHWVVLLFNDILDPQFDWSRTHDRSRLTRRSFLRSIQSITKCKTHQTSNELLH